MGCHRRWQYHVRKLGVAELKRLPTGLAHSNISTRANRAVLFSAMVLAASYSVVAVTPFRSGGDSRGGAVAADSSNTIAFSPAHIRACERSTLRNVVSTRSFTQPIDVAVVFDVSPSWPRDRRQGLEDVGRIVSATIRSGSAHNRAAIIIHSGTHPQSAELLTPLTSDLNRLLRDARRIPQRGSDSLPDGIRVAAGELERGRIASSLRDRESIIVLIGDGDRSAGQIETRRAAADAKRAGHTIFALCSITSGACDVMEDSVSHPDMYFEYEWPETQRAAAQLIERLVSRAVRRAILSHRIDGAVRVLSETVSPPANTTVGALSWAYDDPVAEVVTAMYQVEPSISVFSGVAVTATLRITDDLNGLHEIDGGSAWLDVTGRCYPTETPQPTRSTSTPTRSTTPGTSPVPDATPAPGVRAVFLPLTLNEGCDFRVGGVDIALVVDASTSMLEPTRRGVSKLDAVTEAIGRFLSLLEFPIDRAAMVEFNSDARLLQELTTDRNLLELALQGITVSQQTRIDLGIEEARAALTRASGQRGRERVMAVLTDGHVNPVPDDTVIEIAEAAKADGVKIYTIGLGNNVDGMILERVASGAHRFYHSPDGNDLREIYADIASSMPCRAEQI